MWTRFPTLTIASTESPQSLRFILNLADCFQCLLGCKGCMYTSFCLPFGCMGCGPVVVVNEGERAAVLKYGKFGKWAKCSRFLTELDRIVGPGTYHYNIGTEQFILRSIQVQTLVIPQQRMLTRGMIQFAQRNIFKITLPWRSIVSCFTKLLTSKKRSSMWKTQDLQLVGQIKCKSYISKQILHWVFYHRY